MCSKIYLDTQSVVSFISCLAESKHFYISAQLDE